MERAEDDMTPTDRDELRRRATAALPFGRLVYSGMVESGNQFLAAAHPQAVLALLDALDAAEAERDRLRDFHEAGIQEAYKLLGIEDDGELRTKWVLLGISQLSARLAAVEGERDRYKTALVQIASYDEGPVVTASFDCPADAAIARAALEPEAT